MPTEHFGRRLRPAGSMKRFLFRMELRPSFVRVLAADSASRIVCFRTGRTEATASLIVGVKPHERQIVGSCRVSTLEDMTHMGLLERSGAEKTDWSDSGVDRWYPTELGLRARQAYYEG